jgi:hypothetical protein
MQKRETKKHEREKIRAFSEGGEQPAVNPPSGTKKNHQQWGL